MVGGLSLLLLTEWFVGWLVGYYVHILLIYTTNSVLNLT